MGGWKSLDISMKEIIIEPNYKCVTQQVIAFTLILSKTLYAGLSLNTKKVILLLDIRLAEEGKELRIVVISELYRFNNA